MDFSFSPEQEELRAHAKQLLDDVCPPDYAERCDTEARPPREAYQALAGHGWFGLIIPPEFGGTGGSAIDLAILLEETGRHFEELAMWLFRTLTYGGYAIMRDGTPEQKKGLLPRIARGEISFCFGLSEPASGSDAAALMTRAKATNEGYTIDGQKVFTSGMDISDYCLLVARTSTGAKKQQGITTFLVDTKLPGIEIRKIPTLGQRAIGTTQVFYSGVKVRYWARSTRAGRPSTPTSGTSGFVYRRRAPARPAQPSTTRSTTPRTANSSARRSANSRRSRTSSPT